MRYYWYDDKLCVSNLCDDKLCVDNVWTRDDGRRRRRRRTAGYRTKNKNPTQRCGEQEPHTKMRGIKKGRAKYSLNTHLSLPN